ncbi:hypothetical protein FPQ10_12505 [Allobacillus sp. SKP2-8]|uniref:hypothetical protein n=1 Tax=unclassified Allobacillus TaxID=2628859 RepID=UPI001182A137|nr:hypothetical protein [Allobacillus sp. SKP2-8]TSJ61207.1 hypothetical protein FPQ10_12505 [Allobacillus sp. SKP2-8]
MRFGLELFRIAVIVLLLGGLGWFLLNEIYASIDQTIELKWLGAIAILLLVFVLYRNKLQFTGWYQGSKNVKLPKSVTYLLVFSAVIFMIIPIIIGLL